MLVVDRELRVQAWNQAARDLWGLRSDEVHGQHVLNLDIGLPVDLLRAPLRTALGGEAPPEQVVDAINRRGRPIRCELLSPPTATTCAARS